MSFEKTDPETARKIFAGWAKQAKLAGQKDPMQGVIQEEDLDPSQLVRLNRAIPSIHAMRAEVQARPSEVIDGKHAKKLEQGVCTEFGEVKDKE